ncbi:MAG: acyl-CoA dehydrogenase family protein, partial [Ideonella sp.]
MRLIGSAGSPINSAGSTSRCSAASAATISPSALPADTGLLALRVPETLGGSGLDARASVVLAEEVGRSTHGGFAITVLVHTDMASPHLLRFGNR